MPERGTDNTFIGIYRAAEPIQDRRNHPTLVPAGSYPRLIGIDGRFAGSFRRFPGFSSVVDISSIPLEQIAGGPTATSIPANASVWFFKYVTVQVIPKIRAKGGSASSRALEPVPGATSRVLRGFLVSHPYTLVTGTTGLFDGQTFGVLRFVYWEPVGGAWSSKTLLMELDSALTRELSIDVGHTDFASTINVDSEIDVASYGPFITFCLNKATPTGLTSDPASGETPRDSYRKSIRVVSTGPLAGDVEWQFTEFGPLHHPAGWDAQSSQWVAVGTGGVLSGEVATSVRIFSLFKNVEGPLLLETNQVDSPITFDKWRITNLTAALPPLLTLGVDDDKLGYRMRGYRTLDSDSFAGVDGGISVVGGTFFRELEAGFQTRTGSTDSNNSLPSVAFPEGAQGSGDFGAGNFTLDLGENADAVIARGARIDPFVDDTAFAPDRLHRLLLYQGTLLRTGSTPVAGPPKTTVDRDNILSWGALTKFSPEQCRIADSTPLGSQQDEVIHALVGAGDYAFAVGDSGIFRMQRSGQILSITQLQSLTGGVGRYAAIGVGVSLFFIAPNAMYVVDGATGAFQVVTVMDRIINEDWRGKLSSIRMAYDNRLGALFILNTDSAVQEAVLLWSNTGVVTTLKDMTFSFGTEGVNPSDAGFHRSFWITQKGLEVFTPNAERSQGEALTMVGGGATGVQSHPVQWTGTLREMHSSPTPAIVTQITTIQIPFAGQIRDFPVLPESSAFLYVLTGAQAGTRVRITTSVNGNFMLFEPMAGAIGLDDIFSIAPVPFEVIGWPLQDPQQGLDVFQVKIVTALGHNIQLLGGNTGGTHSVSHRLYRRGDLTASIAEVAASMDPDPSKNYSYVNQRGPTLHPSWVQLSSDLDFELLSGIVYAKMTGSEAESSPG